jgi:hypothetical protein
MKKQHFVHFILLVFLYFFGNNSTKAQQIQVIGAAGNHLAGNTRQIAFTIGEPFVQSLVGDGVLLTQGFHQPRLWITAIDEFVLSNFEIKAYPNPTTDVIHLTTDKLLPGNVEYQLTDMNGRLLDTKPLNGALTEIPVSHLVSATYFLRVADKKQTYRTFKIIKK